jgi:heme-degrading monooxygenase HmoA
VVTIGMDYRVTNGKQDAFISMFNKVVEIMTNAAGHQSSRLYRDVNDSCAFLIVSEWTEEDRFRAFIESSTFAKVAQWGKERILDGRPRHRVYGSPARDEEGTDKREKASVDR